MSPSLVPVVIMIWRLTRVVMSPGLACLTELVPGVLRAGGRGGERGVGELEVLTGQRVIVQPQQTGDQLRPARPRLRVMHPAALDHLPQSPGAVARPAHAVAVLDQLQERLQCGHVLVGCVAPGDDLPQQHTEGPDIGLEVTLI